MAKLNSEEKKYLRFTIKDNIIIGDEVGKKEMRSVPKILLDAMSDASDRMSIINADTDERVTYAQMRDRSVRCAVWLKKQRITKDDIVSISSPNQMHDYIPYFATYYVNAIASPWHFKFTKASAQYYLDLMKPKIVFAYEQFIDALAEVAEELGIVCLFIVFGKHRKFKSLEDVLAEQTQEEVDMFTYVESEDPKNQVALMLSTSGSTGNPKYIMISYQALAMATSIPKNFVVFWYTPLLWTTGAIFALSCAYAQGTRIIHAEFNPKEIAKVIEKCRVNWILFVPRTLTAMYKESIFGSKIYDFSSLKILLCGGSCISKSVLTAVKNALPHVLVSNAYGQTESGGGITSFTKNCKDIASVGHIRKDVQLKIINLATGKRLGPNKNGEICIKLDRLMLGYYKNPEATKKVIDDEGWLHTGDLGHYDESGEITLVSRIQDEVIARVNSENDQVFLSEIEGILLEHPNVKEVAVVSVPHKIDGQRPIAFVVKAPDAKVTAEELQELPAKYCKYYRITGGVVFVDHLPYTATEKVKVSELKEWTKAYIK